MTESEREWRERVAPTVKHYKGCIADLKARNAAETGRMEGQLAGKQEALDIVSRHYKRVKAHRDRLKAVIHELLDAACVEGHTYGGILFSGQYSPEELARLQDAENALRAAVENEPEAEEETDAPSLS